MSLRLQDHPLRVDHNVSLAPGALFGASIAVRFATSRRLDRLTVDDPRTGLAITSRLRPPALPQGRVDALPGAVETPAPEVVVERLPRRKRVRQQPPGTAAADAVQDAVEDLTHRREPRATGRGRNRQQRFELTVVRVREIRVVCVSCHAPSIARTTPQLFRQFLVGQPAYNWWCSTPEWYPVNCSATH